MKSKKLVEVGFETKTDFVIAMINGRKFYVYEDSRYYCHFNPNASQPFRYGGDRLEVFWNSYGNLYEEVEVEWHEDIQDKGIPCWVSNASAEERKSLTIVHAYRKEFERPYLGDGANTWTYATPMRPSDCWAYEDNGA